MERVFLLFISAIPFILFLLNSHCAKNLTHPTRGRPTLRAAQIEQTTEEKSITNISEIKEIHGDSATREVHRFAGWLKNRENIKDAVHDRLLYLTSDPSKELLSFSLNAVKFNTVLIVFVGPVVTAAVSSTIEEVHGR